MKIDDSTGKISPGDKQALLDFIINDLLSTPKERSWLSVIRIRDDGATGATGYWTALFHFDPHNPTDISALAGVIVLNHFYLKTLDQFKQTLAHEYGHHWTLCYCAVNHDVDNKRRLPRSYYSIRGLSKQNYAHDYSKGWKHCDREVIAEDYRILFSPYTSNHRMSTNIGNPHGFLGQPNNHVKDFIEKLQF